MMTCVIVRQCEFCRDSRGSGNCHRINGRLTTRQPRFARGAELGVAMNKFNKMVVLLASATMAVAAPAMADPFSFSFTGTNVSGSGTIFTSGTGTQRTVTSVTGTIFDSEVGSGPFAITTLSTYAGADNIYYSTSPFVDFGGISFNTLNGGTFNLGLGGPPNGGGTLLNASVLNPGGIAGVAGSTSISLVSAAAAVPEPATWGMMIFGMGAVGFAMRRRVRASEVKFNAKIKRFAEGATA